MSDSIWKKELSFKKKAKAQADPDAFDLPKQSFLKKEISFSRKAKAPAEPKAVKEPKAAKESIWKKDLSLGKKKDKDRASEIERLAEQAAQAVEPVALPVEPVLLPQPTELAEAYVAAMPEPDLPEPVEPVALAVVPEPPIGLVPDEQAHVPLPPIELAPVELPPDLNAVAGLPVELVVEAEPWLTEPELPPAPAPAAPAVHPPVPAAELPPLAPEKRTPFWKKELSVSRKPKAEKAPKAPRAAKARRPARMPKEKGAPFWKKELSFGRKPKAVALDAPTEELPAAAKTPLLKRKLAMPSLALPKLPSRGGVKGGHSAKRLVGLKIGASQIAAARISNNGVAELQQIARGPLAAGVVVAGELRDPEALGDALKVFFARHKLPKKGVRLGIASNRIGVRILEIVGVEEEKQLANAVQFRAQEALPIPLDEAVLDYRVLEEWVDAEGQKVKRVLLVVAYRELVDRYVSACRKAGINLAGIDLEAFALLRALGAPADREGSALVAVAIGHDRSTFAVSDGRICEFTRVVEWGGSALNVALARAFDSTPSEVETMKRSLSLDGTTTPEDLTPEQATVALDAVRRQLQSFARELVSSLQFYQNQPGSLGIGEIVLTGGTAHLPGLAEELERLIGVHVRIGDPFARLKVGKRFAGTEQIGSLAVAIGLGIED
jgi:type IV pilus assembly protein PilM